HYHRGLLGINLWTKDMPVDEMNHFAVDMIGNLVQMLRDSTGDEKMIRILEEAGREITQHLNEQAKQEQQGVPADSPADSLDGLLEQTRNRLQKNS
ncbi:MAG: gliding motility protein GldC, partial [Anaerolineae bacterium]|nr:gliding motility protein GldC [Anaerolineae bacterium]